MEIEETIQAVRANLQRVILGHPQAIEHILVALIAGGHVLLEDVPGVGKTTLARALARTIKGRFQRIQFTPDLLPADVLGVSIYNAETRDFEFREGPVFTNVLLADEINRASPRTQSALLQAMSEAQVTMDGRTHDLGTPYFVMATQNPVEFQGTYPLPEAQLDRFLLQTSLGYPDPETEVDILYGQSKQHPLKELKPCIDCQGVLRLQESALEVRVDRSVARYMIDIVKATRNHADISVGASPRGSLALFAACRALALVRGRTYCLPDDVKEMAVVTLSHRLVLDTKARYSGITGRQLLEKLLDEMKVPS